MKSVLVLVLAPALAACVPAGPDEDPHGGAGAHFVPSAAASGKPFVTTDGWTVTVDRLALSVIFNAAAAPTPAEVAKGSGGSSSGGNFLFDASKEEDVVLRALPARHTDLSISLWEAGFVTDNFARDPPGTHGVDAALAARFSEPADSIEPDPNVQSEDGSRPSVIFAVHGERGGRTVRCDLSLDSFSGSATGGVDLQPNTLTELTFEVVAEALFTNDAGVLVFDDFGAADRDGDGEISPRELRSYDVPPCKGCSDEEKFNAESDASKNALSVVLDNRTARLFAVK